MSEKIFISYRWDDEPGFAQALLKALQPAFLRDEVFMDVESIKGGEDLKKKIEDTVQRCDVLLAVIGPRWLAAHDEHGRRRLDNDNDLVRNEIALAFQLGKCVIPVLVKDARLPAHDALPEDVRPLSWRKAIPLRHEQFSADCQGLIVRLRVELEKARLKRPGDAHDTPADELTAMREEFAKLAKAHLRLRMLARILSLVVAAETAVLALFGYQGLLRKITGLLQPR